MPNTTKSKCYVASPYGFAEGTNFFYAQKLLPLLRQYVEVLDPWSVDVDQIFCAPLSERPKLLLDLGDYHYKTIKTKADLVVACLDQEPPDNGTVCELSFAAANRIPVIGYRSDLRTTGEESLPYNLMIGSAIRASGGVSVYSLSELEREINNPSTQNLKRALNR